MAYPEDISEGSPRPASGREPASASDPIEAANARLVTALDALEAAVERRREQAHGEKMLAAQVHALGADRSRLAADLDAQTAVARRLEAANREIARRLDVAIDTIRSVLDEHDH